MSDEARFKELDERISALRVACEQYEQAIGLISELLTAVVMAVPQEIARYGHARKHVENVLANRDAMGMPIPETPRRLAEVFLDDLQSLAAVDGGPSAPSSPRRARFAVIRGSKE